MWHHSADSFAEWLLKGLAAHYYGIPAPKRQTVKAVITTDIEKPDWFEMLSRVHVSRSAEGFNAELLPRKGSIAFTIREGNGLLILPIGCSGVNAGDTVEVQLLTGEEWI